MHLSPRCLAITRITLVLAGLGLMLVSYAAPVAAQFMEHCGEITSNETWTEASSPHLVSCDVTVKNSTLTLQPRVRVLMADGASLIIDAGSSLNATGAQDGKIRFTGVEDVAGYWSQIRFEPGALPSTMISVDMMSGGKDGVPMVEGHSVVAMNDVEFRMAGKAPLAFFADALGPSLEGPGQATVGRQCELVRFQGNGEQLIEILAAEDIDVTEMQTWYNFCVPYRVRDVVTIGGPDSPSLRIGPGAILKFSGDAGMVVGVDDENLGGLEIDGTVGEPVVLTAETLEPGTWGSIELTESSVFNSLINTRIEYGGRGGEPMLVVRGEDTIALELQLAHAERYPLALLPKAVDAFVSALSTAEKAVFVENGLDAILVMADEEEIDIPYTAEWRDIGAGYEVDGTLTVAGDGEDAELVLTAGYRPGDELRITFREGQSLVVGSEGALRIRGTESPTMTKPVLLTGAGGAPGSWAGIEITDEASFANFDFGVIEYGGGGGVPMVDWGEASGALLRTTLRNAEGYPLAIPLSQARAIMPDYEANGDLRNVVEGSGVNRFLVEADEPLTRDLTVWGDPGAPVEFTGDVLVASPGTPLLRLHDGLTLLFREGAHLQLGSGVDSRAAVTLLDEGEAPITFGPADPEVGWDGIRVMRGSTLSGEDAVFEGVGDAASNLMVQDGTVVLEDVAFEGESRGTGIDVRGKRARVEITSSRIDSYRVGVHTDDGGWMQLSRSFVVGNTEYGFLNDDPTVCQAANLIWWGAATGPNDASDAEDGCMNAANVSPGGQNVSDDVNWWPYAIDESFTPSPGIGPSPWRVYLPLASQRYTLK